MSLHDVLRRKPQPHARIAAAAACQFDLLLSTTKHVIPLAALVSTGQVFNGLWSSMATAQVLHKLPPMRPEMHHLLVVGAGLLHTLLCASKNSLDQMSGQPEGLLQLQWRWSITDVLAVANVMTMGATFSSVAGAGNEPTFCASFAAGIAMRMFLYEALPPAATGWLAAQTRSATKIELVGVDEVAVRASGVVGTCAGGPVRFLLGSISTPSLLQPAAILAKVVLLCLPALAMGQWATHVVYLTKRIRRENERVNERPRKLHTGELLVPVLRRRRLFSVTLLICHAILVVYFAAFNLNAISSSLGSLLIVALSGCHFESLLSTYDVRGRLRSVVFFLLFILL